MTVEASANALAEAVAAKASLETTPLHDAVNALKALTAYLTMLKSKHAPDDPPPDDDEPSFDDFKGELRAAEEGTNGSTAVAARSHRGS